MLLSSIVPCQEDGPDQAAYLYSVPSRQPYLDRLVVQGNRSVHTDGSGGIAINPFTRMREVGVDSPHGRNDFDVEKSSREDEVQVSELINIDPATESRYVEIVLGYISK